MNEYKDYFGITENEKMKTINTPFEEIGKDENKIELNDKNFDVRVFGTPIAFQLADSNIKKEWREEYKEEDFYLAFDGIDNSENSLLIKRFGNKIVYTLLKSENVITAKGRGNGKFGMSIELKDIYCDDIEGIYDLINEIFEKIITDPEKGFLLKNANGSYKFNIDDFGKIKGKIAEIKGIVKKNLEKYFAEDFKNMNDGEFDKKFENGKLLKFNIKPIKEDASMEKVENKNDVEKTEGIENKEWTEEDEETLKSILEGIEEIKKTIGKIRRRRS